MLDKILVDHETGKSAADKINLAFDAIDTLGQGGSGQPGQDGKDGKSAFELAQAQGYTGTEAEWLVSIEGKDGTDGHDGAAGKSSYDSWINSGQQGTEQDFIYSLEGPQGIQGFKGDKGPEGPEGPKGPKGDDGSNGKDGAGVTIKGSKTIAEILAIASPVDGDMYIATDDNQNAVPPGKIGDGYAFIGGSWTNVGAIQGPSGNNGTNGVDGTDGKSAYQEWLDAGNTGNEGEFLQDLIGPDGADGIGVQIKGSDTLANIQATNGQIGDIYISTDAPIGHGWVSDGKTGPTSWTDFGMFQGPKGDTGPAGSGGGAGIDPADQAKLDHITVTKDIDLDGVILADGSVKVNQNLVIGDRTGEAQLTLDAKAATASHTIFKREGVAKASIGVSVAANDQLTIEQRVDGNIKFVVPDGYKVEAKIGSKFHTFAMLDDIPTGSGITPADQAKLDHITIASDLDIDTIDANAKSAIAQVQALNLDGSGTNLLTTKEIELSAAQVVDPDPAVAIKDNRLMSVSSVYGMMHSLEHNAMMDKGNITDLDNIKEIGIYHGGTTVPNDASKNVNVVNSPIGGAIMVMASKDPGGNFGYFLMGSDKMLYTGAKPAGQAYSFSKAGDATGESVKLDNYTKPQAGGTIAPVDSVNIAIGKLEAGLANATAGGGDKNVKSDWNQGDNTVDDYIKNKPGVINDLTTGGVTDILSAEQGKSLKIIIDSLFDTSGATLKTTKDIELAQAQVVPSDPAAALKDNRMITVGATIKAFNNMSVKVMMEKGAITDISGITETGIYEGTDVANSPITGPIMVMANKDTNGDFGFFLMGADGALHTGGKAQLGKTFWTEIKSKAVAEGTIEVDASYSGRFVSPNMDTFTGQATHDIFDTKEHKVIFTDKPGNDWTTDKDPYTWYLKGGGELGHFKGASGHVGSKVMEGWVKHQNIITIQYTDSSKKEFNVLKVEGDIQVSGSDHLVADGSVTMIPSYKPSKPNSIATKEYADSTSKPTGLFDFDYDVKIGTAMILPEDGIIGFNHADPKSATKLLIGTKDRNGTDMTLFLEAIMEHDWLNIHSAGDYNTVVAFDVVSSKAVAGGVEVEVQKIFDQGTLVDKERTFTHWERNVLGNPSKDGQVLSGNTNGIKDWIDLPAGIAVADKTKLDFISVTKAVDLDLVSTVQHLHGTTAPADTLGQDGDTYFKI